MQNPVDRVYCQTDSIPKPESRNNALLTDTESDTKGPARQRSSAKLQKWVQNSAARIETQYAGGSNASRRQRSWYLRRV
jgi:hypothetical protein